MYFIVIVLLFCFACGVGYLFERENKERLTYKQNGNTFIIHYGKRKINIVIDKKIKMSSYFIPKKNVETITVSITEPDKTITQLEHFISRYHTSRLVKILFNFSSMRDPVWLIYFDPFNAKMFLSMQFKLKAFLRNQ
jgi:hypothetical protein